MNPTQLRIPFITLLLIMSLGLWGCGNSGSGSPNVQPPVSLSTPDLGSERIRLDVNPVAETTLLPETRLTGFPIYLPMRVENPIQKDNYWITWQDEALNDQIIATSKSNLDMSIPGCKLPAGSNKITAVAYHPLDFDLKRPLATSSAVTLNLTPDDCGSPSPSPSPTPSCPQPSPPAPPISCTTPSPSPTSSPSPTAPPTPPRDRCAPPPAPPAPAGSSPISIPGGGGGGGCSDAHTWGDPHLLTFDGIAYDFHAVGEFILARSQDQTFEVQARQKPIYGNIARNDAIALKLGSDRLTIAAGSPNLIRLNGKPVLNTPEILSLAGGVIYRNAENQLAAVWRTGEQVILDLNGIYGSTFLSPTIRIPNSRKGQYIGLLGDGDGDTTNDIKPRNGSVITGALTFEQLYKTFGNSWRISQAESLFDYGSGESTATFTDLIYPDRVFSTSSLSDAERIRAEGVCRNAGVTGALLNGCIIDVGVTGDSRLAQAVPTPDKVPTSLGVLSVIAKINVDRSRFSSDNQSGGNQIVKMGDDFLVNQNRLALQESTTSILRAKQDGTSSYLVSFRGDGITNIHATDDTAYFATRTFIQKVDNSGKVSNFKQFDRSSFINGISNDKADIVFINSLGVSTVDPMPGERGVFRISPDGRSKKITLESNFTDPQVIGDELLVRSVNISTGRGGDKVFKLLSSGEKTLIYDLNEVSRSLGYGSISGFTALENGYIAVINNFPNDYILKIDKQGKAEVVFTKKILGLNIFQYVVSNVIVKGNDMFFLIDDEDTSRAVNRYLVRQSL